MAFVVYLWSVLLEFLSWTWWFWAFLILWPLFKSTWIYWRNEWFEESSNFRTLVLEMLIPREIKRNPKAMEQVLMGIHQLRNAPGDFREYWWDGELTRWISLEMASFGGEVHFYLRVYYKQRGLIEASFYANYPDIELVEVDDYTSRFPKDIHEMYRQGYDLWGGEMKLAREGAYPIKSWLEFESPEEEKQYDPMGQFLEVLGKIKREEMVAIQILAAPALDNWIKPHEAIVRKLKESKFKEGAQGSAKTAAEFPGGPLPALSTASEKSDALSAMQRILFQRTPGETDVLKAVEENLAQPAFRCMVRFIYFSPKTMFYDSFARRGLSGCFNQYATLDLNRFLVNYAVSTRTKLWQKPFIFPKLRNEYRKQRLLEYFKHRRYAPHRIVGKFMTSYWLNWNFSNKECELSVASLATLYHPPMYVTLTAPHVRRVESRKVAPPAGLAIYGGEEEIDRFK